MPNIAVYAGTFDPFTNGHLSMVKEASKIFDTVYILFAINSNKQKRYGSYFMRPAVEEVIERENLPNVKIHSTMGLTVDACHEVGASYIIRGLRSTSDFLYEDDIARVNSRLAPEIKTVYLRAEDDVLSSSMVREMINYGRDVSAYVPPEILKLINEK